MGRPKKSLKDQIESETVIKTGAGLASQVEKSKGKSKNYVLDLRIHSPASLGYLGIEGIDTAPALVRLAKVKGLDIIAVTDFYSGEFIDRITAAAKESELSVIPGVCLRCAVAGCNEVMVSCLFPENYSTLMIQEFLQELNIPTDVAGDKNFCVSQPFSEVLRLVEARGGVVLPSRMDKTPYRLSIIPTLVEQYGFRAFDIVYPDTVRYFKSRWPKIKFQLFSFSNANALAQVGSRIARVKMQESGFEGVKTLVEREALLA